MAFWSSAPFHHHYHHHSPSPPPEWVGGGGTNPMGNKSLPLGCKYFSSHTNFPSSSPITLRQFQLPHLSKTKYPMIQSETLKKSGWKQEWSTPSESPKLGLEEVWGQEFGVEVIWSKFRNVCFISKIGDLIPAILAQTWTCTNHFTCLNLSMFSFV